MNDINESCLNLDGDVIADFELTPQEYGILIQIQTEMMRLVGVRESHQTILSSLCKKAEELIPNAVASIMILDNDSGFLDVLAAPSLSEEGVEALNGLCPGPGGGSCGNAIYHKEVQYITAIKSDKRWDDLRDLADTFGLAACWSRPVRNDANEVIGTFALSSFEERVPNDFHKSLLAVCATIVSIVLAREEDTVA